RVARLTCISLLKVRRTSRLQFRSIPRQLLHDVLAISIVYLVVRRPYSVCSGGISHGKSRSPPFWCDHFREKEIEYGNSRKTSTANSYARSRRSDRRIRRRSFRFCPGASASVRHRLPYARKRSGSRGCRARRMDAVAVYESGGG